MNYVLNKIIEKHLTSIEEELEYTSSVLISKSKSSEKKFNKYLNTLQRLLADTYNEQSKSAIKEVIDYLLSLNRENFSQADIKKIDSILKSRLGKGYLELVVNRLYKIAELFYQLGAFEIAEAIDFKISFDVTDTDAVNALLEQFNFWIGNYYNEHLQSEIKETLKGYFDSNKTIEEVALEFSKKFEKYSDNGMDYFEGLAEHTSNRIRAVGQVTGMEKAGITSYQIVAVLDARTSEICKFMDGKIFELSRAIEYREKILSLKDPSDIKNYSKWISPKDLKAIQEQKITDPDLPAGLTIPPFHWRCRTTIRAYFQ